MTTPTLCVLQSRAARAVVKLVTLEPTRMSILFGQTLLSGARFDLELRAMASAMIATVAADDVTMLHLSLSLCSN